MRVTVFDYGAGNLHSLRKALAVAAPPPSNEIVVEPDPRRAVDTDVLVLPGVGAFGEAAVRLQPGLVAMREALRRGLPCVGVCLGMQLLFERSEEGDGEGLGFFAGEVVRLQTRRVPHIGWNQVVGALPGQPAGGGADGRDFAAYFAHSYVCRPRVARELGRGDPMDDPAVAWTEHEGQRFVSAVRRGRVIGLQFHPEKSSLAGVRLLAACIEEVRR